MNQKLLIVFLIVIILFLFYKYLRIKIKQYIEKQKNKKQLAKGYKKEKEAAKVLKSLGYKIITHGKTYHYTLKVNGKNKTINLEIDYLVSKNGKTYIVEVKSGNSAPHITNSSTRRQILEYYTFIPNNGILLLDMENNKIALIEFPFKKRNNLIRNWIIFLLIFTIIIFLYCFYTY